MQMTTKITKTTKGATVLEMIAMAKVSTSAAEARGLGLLAPSDRITLNRERLLLDAKEQVEALAEAGYSAPVARTQIGAPGTAALAALEMGIYLMGEAGYASEHDQKVARAGQLIRNTNRRFHRRRSGLGSQGFSSPRIRHPGTVARGYADASPRAVG